MSGHSVPAGHTTISWRDVGLLCRAVLDHGPAPLPADIAKIVSELVHRAPTEAGTASAELRALRDEVLAPGVAGPLDVISTAMRLVAAIAHRAPSARAPIRCWPSSLSCPAFWSLPARGTDGCSPAAARSVIATLVTTLEPLRQEHL